MTPRDMAIQAWNLYQKLVDLERSRYRGRRNQNHSELIYGYSGRRKDRLKTKLHRLSIRAYERYHRRLEACLRNDNDNTTTI